MIFNAEADVVGNYIYILFTAAGSNSPISLYAQDFPSNKPGQSGAGDEYTDSISWLIPSFAPLGHYHAEISLHGADKEKDVWDCLFADLDIHA